MKFKSTTNLRELPLVEIDWIDAAGLGGWQQVSDIKEFRPLQCRSVGYLLERTKRQVKLGSSVNEAGQVSDILVVPVPWLTKLRVIRKGKVLA